MAEESGLAAVVDMNMLSGPYSFCGYAVGNAIFDDRVPFFNFWAGNFMAKWNRLR
jgi:hypothetical protein